MRWLIVVVLVLTALSIRIPIVPNQKRCMVAFVYGNGETVKLHMKFPKSRNTEYEENWHIAITDTETKVTQDFEVSHGHFRQELETEQSTTRGTNCRRALRNLLLDKRQTNRGLLPLLRG